MMLFFVQLCPAKFESFTKLLNHANNHNNHSCKRCDKKYASKLALFYHNREHDKNVLICKVSEGHAFIIEKLSVQNALKYIGTLTEQINKKVF